MSIFYDLRSIYQNHQLSNPLFIRHKKWRIYWNYKFFHEECITFIFNILCPQTNLTGGERSLRNCWLTMWSMVSFEWYMLLCLLIFCRRLVSPRYRICDKAFIWSNSKIWLRWGNRNWWVMWRWYVLRIISRQKYWEH